ncbi:MAG: hypothetical protein K6A82_06010 [Prevotella sp.]|nr:hypothetical protein [Prevotella sp.]
MKKENYVSPRMKYVPIRGEELMGMSIPDTKTVTIMPGPPPGPPEAKESLGGTVSASDETSVHSVWDD